MWLITKIPANLVSKAGDRLSDNRDNRREEILDLCLGLSPNVSITHDPYVLIDLKSVSRYWNLPALRKATDLIDLADFTEGCHPFFDKLHQLHKKFGLAFLMAPTAPWAISLFENPPAEATQVSAKSGVGTHEPILRIFDTEQANAAMLARPLDQNATLLSDVFRKKEDRRHEFTEATIELEDLGFGMTHKLVQSTRDVEKKTAFVSRFGSLIKKLLKRIDGADDLDVRYYSPSTTLTEKVYIAAHAANVSLPNVPTAAILPPAAVGTPFHSSRNNTNNNGPVSARIASSQIALASAIKMAHAQRGDVLEPYEKNLPAAYEAPPPDFFTSLTGKSRELPRIVRDTSGGSEGVLDHLYDVLSKWESRLAARQSLLRGIIVRLYSSRGRKREEISVTLPRATRSAESLYKVFFERWIARANRSSQNYLELQGFEDEIDSFEVESMAIEHDRDRQLDLFDPQREDVEEKWNMLIGQLRSRETQGKPIHIGSYRPFESFLPEQSLKWVEWEENLSVSPIEDHPKRPLILLRSPQPLNEPRIRDDNEFLDFCEKKDLLTSLEKISDPWSMLVAAPKKQSLLSIPTTRTAAQRVSTAKNSLPNTLNRSSAVPSTEDWAKPEKPRFPVNPNISLNGGERSYVRWQEKWIFWEHRQKRLFLHGYFE